MRVSTRSRLSSVKRLQSLDGIGEVAAVVRKVPHDDRQYFAKRSCMIPLQHRTRYSSISLSSCYCSGILRYFSVCRMYDIQQYCCCIRMTQPYEAGYSSNTRTPEKLFLNEIFSLISQFRPHNLRRCASDDRSPRSNAYPRVLDDQRPHELVLVQDTRSQSSVSRQQQCAVESCFSTLPLVHHEADKSTFLVDRAKQCP